VVIRIIFFLLFCFFVSCKQKENTASESPSGKSIAELLDSKDYIKAGIQLSDSLELDAVQGNWAGYIEKMELQVRLFYYLGKDKLKFTDSMLTSVRSAEQIAILHNLTNSPSLASVFNYAAREYNRRDDLIMSLEYYNKAIDIFSTNQVLGAKPAYALKNAAQIYLRQNNYAEAINYLNQSIEVDTGKVKLADSYGQLINAHNYMGEFDISLELYDEIRNYHSLTQSDSAYIEGNVAPAFADKNQFQTARTFTQNALNYYLKDPDEKESQVRLLTALAYYEYELTNSLQVEKYYRQAEKIAKEYYKEKNREMAILYSEWGDFLLKINRKTEALKTYQKGIIQLSPTFNDERITENPTGIQMPLESQIIYLFFEKGQLLLNQDNPDLSTRINASVCFEAARKAASNLRIALSSDADKRFHAYDITILQSLGAENLFKLSDLDKVNKDKWLNQLFLWNEQLRNRSLMDQNRQFQAMGLDVLSEQEHKSFKDLKAKLLQLDQNLGQAQVEKNTPKSAKIQSDLYRSRRELESMEAKLKSKYPRYKSSLEIETFYDLKWVQSNLPKDKSLLVYTCIRGGFLASLVSQTDYEVNFIPRTAQLDSAINDFKVLVKNKNRQLNQPKAYFDQAFYLYNALLPDNFSNRVKANTLILADSDLWAIPFEALITEKYTGKYHSAPWLMSKTSIHYGWGNNQLVRTNQPNASITQFAPFTNAQRIRNLPPLRHSLDEMNKTLPDKSFVSSSATSLNFFKAGSSASILHLSTHGSIDKNGNAQIEAFDRTISSTEFLNASFSHSLVTLSACETASGLINSGEGVQSMTRAFAYGGAASLVAGLWQVNELSSATLFRSFYEYLNAHNSMTRSLRDAKLAYIRSNEIDARKAPYYWAGLTLTGQDGSFDFVENKNYWAYAVAIALLVLGLAFLFLKSKTKKIRS